MKGSMFEHYEFEDGKKSFRAWSRNKGCKQRICDAGHMAYCPLGGGGQERPMKDWEFFSIEKREARRGKLRNIAMY